MQPEQKSKNKTDRRDAGTLGELLWVNRQRMLAGRNVQGVRRVEPATPMDAEARQLTSLRQRIGRLQTRTINKVHQILAKHNLHQVLPTKGIDTKTARKWLRELPLGEINRLELDQLLAQWELWDRQLEELKKPIEVHQREHATVSFVASCPGAGVYGSLALASRIGSIDRFPRPGSLANFWGLTPGCRNSGEVTNRLGSITKQGSAMARFILGQMVLHVLRKDPAMKAWYGRIKRRRGSKIARVAVMRRLATIIWHMVKYEQPYVKGGPPQVKIMQKLMTVMQP